MKNPNHLRMEKFGVRGAKLSAALFAVAGLAAGSLAVGGAIPSAIAQSETGMLRLAANGEAFAREGLVSRDGWEVEFDHLYATIADMTAHQADPPFDADNDEAIASEVQVSHAEPTTVDLAAPDIPEVATVSAPAGRYNAVSWQMVTATEGPAAGNTIAAIGRARKDGREIVFNIGIDMPMAYVCGDYVGDERKGFLSAGETAEVEATFHFDHVFGDADLPADDYLNQNSLGFGPLAALAEDGSLDIRMSELQAQLSEEDYTTLESTISGLAHVGEGHCAIAT